jgi:adenylate cyclase
MAYEIERKFLVTDTSWKAEISDSVLMFQGYICSDRHKAVRVRTAGERAWLTVKSALTHLKRAEYEYEIPLSDANEMLSLCLRPPLEKVRHSLTHAGRHWVIDEYRGENSGLVVAEIELGSEDEEFERPAWVGEEVSEDPRYLSVCLYERPYNSWRID